MLLVRWGPNEHPARNTLSSTLQFPQSVLLVLCTHIQRLFNQVTKLMSGQG